jgi:uncharacterized protein (TIGR02996 family)
MARVEDVELEVVLDPTRDRVQQVLHRSGVRRATTLSFAEGIAALRSFGLDPVWETVVARSPPKTARERLADAARELVASLLGGSPERPADTQVEVGELLDAVRAAWEDDAAWAVLADWLTEHGDPRGALVARELSGENGGGTRAERAVVLGELAGEPHLGIGTHRGFVVSLSVSSKTTSRVLKAFAAHPSSQLLRDVWASSVKGREPGLAALLQARPVHKLSLPERLGTLLDRLGPCPSVRELRVRRTDERLAACFPNVERLTVPGGPRPEHVLAFPALRWVSVRRPVPVELQEALTARGVEVQAR